MLSNDELANGMTFILKLHDATETPVQWVQSLRGDVAKRWYDIYQRSDWAALRSEAADVFQNSVTPQAAEDIRNSGRCIVIDPDDVKASELAPRHQLKPA